MECIKHFKHPIVLQSFGAASQNGEIERKSRITLLNRKNVSSIFPPREPNCTNGACYFFFCTLDKWSESERKGFGKLRHDKANGRIAPLIRSRSALLLSTIKEDQVFTADEEGSSRKTTITSE